MLVPAQGFENHDGASVAGASPGFAEVATATTDDLTPMGADLAALGPTIGPALDAEVALCAALASAAAAGRFDVVSQLARELEARRLAGSNVTAITSRKRG